MLVPHGLVTVSIAAALLPFMSKSTVEGRPREVGSEVARGLLLAGRAMVPIAAAVLAIGPLITRLVFFGNPPEDARFMGLVLAAFAPAIVVFSAQFLVVRGLHALEDTRTPAMIQLLITGMQIVTALTSGAVLPPGWVIVGVAAGFSAAYAMGLAVSLAALRRATATPHGWRLTSAYLRLVSAALPAAATAALVTQVLTARWGTGVVSTAGTLVLAAAVFGIVYGALIRAVGSPPPPDQHRVTGPAAEQEVIR